MIPTDVQWDRERASQLTLEYEELRSAVSGKWDGRSSLPGLGTFMRAGMAAWIRRQVENHNGCTCRPVPRWNAKALPMAFCSEVVGVLTGMVLAATVTAEVQS